MDHPLPSPGDILPALRAATGQAHQQLEDAVDIGRCLADCGRYSRLLQAFLGFYRPLEDRLAALDGWSERGLDLAATRRKTPWLAADLSALGLSASEIDALPTCADLPPTNTLVQGFGCLYVLEGATLGGRQITALLRQSPIPAAARRFFHSYGADTAARWREFLAALEAEAQRGADTDRAETVHAAQETFACLHGWVCARVPRHESPG